MRLHSYLFLYIAPHQVHLQLPLTIHFFSLSDCDSQGAALTWTEMVRAQAIARNNGAALDLIDTHDAADRTPTGLQV